MLSLFHIYVMQNNHCHRVTAHLQLNILLLLLLLLLLLYQYYYYYYYHHHRHNL